MGTTQATIVVSFGDDANADGFYLAELDEVANKGKTSFVPNEEVFFIIQHDETLKILQIVTTNGSIQSHGNVTRTKTETMVFAAEGDEQNLPCLGSSAFSFSFGTASLSVDGVNVAAGAGSYPVVCSASVTGTFQQYSLLPNIPPLAKDETFDVYIFIYFGAA